MGRKTSKNNNLLSNVRSNTSPKIYSILIDLVNDDREDLAEIVVKIDYLLEYASKCINHKDFMEAKETVLRVEERINFLKKEGKDIEYIIYLYEGIKGKIR